jgi:fatty-acyl-CoA synthase
MIISGGENTHDAELENVLAAQPKVAEVAMIRLPDARWGETPMAVIVTRDPADPPTDAAVDTHRRAHLAPCQRPHRVVIVDALPRNANGRVLKITLHERVRRDGFL